MLGQKKDPGLELVGPESLIFRLSCGWKRGAEGQGQGRTDTGLPPPVFEFVAIRDVLIRFSSPVVLGIRA